MKNKRILNLIGVFSIGVLLTGCGHEHTWADATCTAPRTCTECGETEGEALEHTLSEANYQQPVTCEVCGQKVGEPLQADFEKYGLTEKFIELDKEYDCVIACDDMQHTTNAKVIFSNYQTIASGVPENFGNFKINTELPEKEGYEYKIVDITINLSDENAIKYGAYIDPYLEDYYDDAGFNDSWIYEDDGWITFTVNWNGNDYTECRVFGISEWITNADKTYSYNATEIVRVPVGYDGFVIAVLNNLNEAQEGQYIYDLDNTDTLFVRLD